MTTVVRRDFRSIPHRDASATWSAIVDLLTAGGDAAKRVLVPGFPRQGDGSALRLSGSPQKAPIDKQMFIGETLPGWSDQTGRS